MERSTPENTFRLNEAGVQAILDNCNAAIIVKQLDGRYLLINRWIEILFNLKNEDIVGKTDHDLFPEHIADAIRKNDQIVIDSQTPLETEEVVTHPDGSAHTYIILRFLIRDAEQKPYAVSSIATDISKQKEVEAKLSGLSGELMQLQESERRGLAHDLHEGTAQMLAGLGINLGLAHHAVPKGNRILREALDASMKLVEQITNQVRRIAYLLYPPGLDEFGLTPVLRSYVERFSRRSGIAVNIRVGSNLERFGREREMAAFRIVEEALNNILRHSGSDTAEVAVTRDNDELLIEIADQGCGLPADLCNRIIAGLPVPGIGITSMQERSRQFGGVLSIESTGRGVKVVARLPINGARSRSTPPPIPIPHPAAAAGRTS